MLDLQPGVHFEKVEAAVGTRDELDGARAEIADAARQGDRLLAHRAAHVGGDEG